MFLGRKQVRLPNFLIVGAAKAGTTAIASYLAQHPQVYMSPIKEPKFISSHFVKFPLRGPGDDFVEGFTVKRFGEYRGLFRRAYRERAVGEASVENLYFYRRAIPVIKRVLGDVKIIIVLRNPVERAFSAYKMMVRDGREALSFEEALREEPERMRSNWEYLWFYQDVGRYYHQVKAYLHAFSNVRVFLFEDFRRDAPVFMRSVYRFLGVDENFAPRIDLRFNSSGRFRNAFYRFLFRATAFKGMLYKFLSLNGVPDSVILGVIEGIRDGELEPIAAEPEAREMLRKAYRDDILKLQKLLGRDLSHWLE